MNKFANFLSLFFLSISGITLIGLQMKPIGWSLLILGAVITTVLCQKIFKKNILLLYFSLGLLGLAPISTDIYSEHALQLGIFIIGAVAAPYLISHYLYKDLSLQFSFHHGRNWYKKEILYLFLTGLVAYLILPILLRTSGSYHNWVVEPNTAYLIKFFIGINLVGVWDELFFISTTLGILRKHVPFYAANLVQSTLFASFLYELGFRGLLAVVIFGFAFLQGYVFNKTQSLFYLISIHLAADVVLYLALVHAYYPNLMPIFLIK